MKKRVGIAVFFLCLVVLALSISAIMTHPREEEATGKTGSSMVGKPEYVLLAYGDQVAVYRYGETEKPLSILDVYLHNLPEYDQNRLKDGVPAENGEALQRLIEDYTS